jgi:hypothetical protein
MFQQGRAGTGARAAMSAFTWGRDYFAPALPLAPIHRSAWKGYSPKFATCKYICDILVRRDGSRQPPREEVAHERL